MNARIVRQHTGLLAAGLTDSPSTTATIDFREAAGGAIALPDDSPITLLTFYAAVMPGLAPSALCDVEGNPITQIVAAGTIAPLPDACFGVGSLCIVADAAGSVALSLKG